MSSSFVFWAVGTFYTSFGAIHMYVYRAEWRRSLHDQIQHCCCAVWLCSASTKHVCRHCWMSVRVLAPLSASRRSFPRFRPDSFMPMPCFAKLVLPLIGAYLLVLQFELHPNSRHPILGDHALSIDVPTWARFLVYTRGPLFRDRLSREGKPTRRVHFFNE